MASPIDHSDQPKDFSCTSCKLPIADNCDAVECDTCGEWTHSKCCGIPKAVFKHLANNTNLLFSCSNCKTRPNTLPSSHDFAKLFTTVQTLATSVKTLHEDIKLVKPLISAVHTLQEEVRNIKTTLNNLSLPSNSPPTQIDVQEMIREEVLECRERDKRVDSVIIRGLGIEPRELQNKFDDVVSHLLPNKQITLRDITPIKPNLVRAKISDPVSRRELLTTARNLRQSPYTSVFITRDLTFKQRETIRKRFIRTRGPDEEGETSGTNGTGRPSTDRLAVQTSETAPQSPLPQPSAPPAVTPADGKN